MAVVWSVEEVRHERRQGPIDPHTYLALSQEQVLYTDRWSSMNVYTKV